MRYREFGSTGLSVSERGFGAWAIGGCQYGRVTAESAHKALAKAEELGCNFLDTAAVYGDSETVIGKYLRGRRENWIVATKYSGQDEGVTATVESQLRRLHTDRIDFYQLHWVPSRNQSDLYDEIYKLKRDGKVRFLGASLYSVTDIDSVLDNEMLDGFQVRFSLLDPLPFLARLKQIRRRRPIVVVRSCLSKGFLTGKFTSKSNFSDDSDQRRKMSTTEIEALIRSAENFRFVEDSAGSMLAGAIQFPLSFSEISTVLLGTKSVEHAAQNFGQIGDQILGDECLKQIAKQQSKMGLKKRGTLGRVIEEVRRVAKIY